MRVLSSYPFPKCCWENLSAFEKFVKWYLVYLGFNLELDLYMKNQSMWILKCLSLPKMVQRRSIMHWKVRSWNYTWYIFGIMSDYSKYLSLPKMVLRVNILHLKSMRFHLVLIWICVWRFSYLSLHKMMLGIITCIYSLKHENQNDSWTSFTKSYQLWNEQRYFL